MSKKKPAKPRAKKPPKSKLADALAPPTYDALVAQITREHPEYTRQQIEAAIAETQR